MRTRHTRIGGVPLLPSFSRNAGVKRRLLTLLMLINATLPIGRLVLVYNQLKFITKHVYVAGSTEEYKLLGRLCKVIRTSMGTHGMPKYNEEFLAVLDELKTHDAWEELVSAIWVNVVTIHDYNALGIIKKLIDLEIYSGTNIKYRAKLGTDQNLTTYICNKGYLRNMVGDVVHKTTASDRALRRDEGYQLQLLRMNSFRPCYVPEDTHKVILKPHEWLSELTRCVMSELRWNEKVRIVELLDRNPTLWRNILERTKIPNLEDKYRSILESMRNNILEFGRDLRFDKYGRLTRIDPYRSLYRALGSISPNSIPESFNILVTYVEFRPRVIYVPANRYIPQFEQLDVVMRHYWIHRTRGRAETWIRYKDNYKDLQIISDRDHVITNLSKARY